MPKKKKKPGRPRTPRATLEKWITELRPHLVGGASLWGSIERASLEKHKNIIYRNYTLNEKFRERIDAFQAVIGEYTNETFYTLVTQIRDKVKRKESITRDEIQILKIVAEKHRTSQPFFVSRTESAQAKDEDFGKVIERPTLEVNLVPEKKNKKKKLEKPEDDKGNANNQEAESEAGRDAETVDSVPVPAGPDNE